MKILPINPKVRTHMTLAAVVILLLVPFVILAALMLLGLVSGAAATDEFEWWHLRAAIWLTIPIFLWVWGVILISQLRDGFTTRMRRRMFLFYVSLLSYCGVWMVLPYKREGELIEIFSFPVTLVLTTILSIPVFATMFTNGDDGLPNQSSAGSGTRP